MEEGFDYDGHFRWFSRELKHEPNPRRLFQDAFNAAPIETIPRDGAKRMLCFYLSAREREEFPGGEYPPEVTRKAEALLAALESAHGLKFKRASNSSGDGGGAATEPEPRTDKAKTSSGETPRERSASDASSVFSAVRDFLVTGGGASSGGVESDLEPPSVDFIRPNRFDMVPYYKPVVFRALIYAFRAHAARSLVRAGFERRRDEATDIVLWVRPPEPLPPPGARGDGRAESPPPRAVSPDRYNPLLFLHGIGIGIAPYAEYVGALPRDRPVLAPEWPNISYGRDRSHRYPSPSEMSAFLERATRRAAEDAYARDFEGTGVVVRQEDVVRAGKRSVCDVIAHSYGTVVLTGFRRHYPRSTRRRAYLDPVCFLPSFGSYLRYGFDDHLTSWRDMLAHLADRAEDPHEPMSTGNLILASWFLKGDAGNQQLMKRLLFPHESWERGPLREDDVVVLSGLDEIVGARETKRRFERAFPRCEVILEENWQHGGFLLEPDPRGVNRRVVAHVQGKKKGSNPGGASFWKKRPGIIRRAWRWGFAKRRERKRRDVEARRRDRRGDAERGADENEGGSRGAKRARP